MDGQEADAAVEIVKGRKVLTKVACEESLLGSCQPAGRYVPSGTDAEVGQTDQRQEDDGDHGELLHAFVLGGRDGVEDEVDHAFGGALELVQIVRDQDAVVQYIGEVRKLGIGRIHQHVLLFSIRAAMWSSHDNPPSWG